MVDFPNAPIEGQTHTEEGQTWTYIGGAWIVGLNSVNLLEIVEDEFIGLGRRGLQIVGGVMIQWGWFDTDANGEGSITFYKEFKNIPIILTDAYWANAVTNTTFRTTGETTTGVEVLAQDVNGTPLEFNGNGRWIAIGEALDADKKPKGIPYGAGGGGGNGNVTTGAILPPTPSVGDLHYLTVAPVGLYVYYNDGDSNQWVQANGANVPPQRQIYRLRVGTSYSWSNGNDVNAKIIFDTEVGRLGPSFATYDQATGVFTFTEAGWYDINAQVRWQGPTDGLRTLGFLNISKNDGGGTATQAVGYNRNTSGTNFNTDLASVTANSLIYADVGDTAEVYLTFRKESGSGPTVSHTIGANGTWVNIERVG